MKTFKKCVWGLVIAIATLAVAMGTVQLGEWMRGESSSHHILIVPPPAR